MREVTHLVMPMAEDDAGSSFVVSFSSDRWMIPNSGMVDYMAAKGRPLLLLRAQAVALALEGRGEIWHWSSVASAQDWRPASLMEEQSEECRSAGGLVGGEVMVDHHQHLSSSISTRMTWDGVRCGMEGRGNNDDGRTNTEGDQVQQ